MTLKILRWLVVVSLVVGLDQLVKLWFSLYSRSQIQLNFLGAGSLNLFGESNTPWIILAGVVLISILIYLVKSNELDSKNWFGWALIWGGGMSNWLDRLTLGGVRDFWPILGTDLKNNLADYALTFGLIWLMINSLLELTKKPGKIL